jgi:hypothetical protein
VYPFLFSCIFHSFFRTLTSTCTISKNPPSDIDHALVAARASQLVERLSEENKALREELDGYYKKVSKLQKVGGIPRISPLPFRVHK